MFVIDIPCHANVIRIQPAPGLWWVAAALDVAAAQAPPEAVSYADEQHWRDSRRQSFLAGRGMAQQALHALGRPAPVLRVADGAPLWPSSVVGSIAHSAQYAVAVVAVAGQTLALGIDVEPDAPLPPDAAAVVLLPQDHVALTTAFGERAAAHSRLIFSAKECVHKAINPSTGAWLEFDEVAIEWLATAANQGRWQALPISEAACAAFGGRALIGDWWRAGGALWTLLRF